MWALYFDKEADHLTTRDDMVGHKKLRMLQVALSRREKQRTKEEEEADRSERVERQKKRAEQDARRAEEKKLPVQEVFRRAKEEGASGGDDFDVRVKHEEEVDD